MSTDSITIQTDLFPQISAAIHGQGDETILLLHGFPATGTLWRELLPLLADQYRVIVPDLPGVGRSVPGKQPVSIEDLGRGMISLLDALQIDQALIAGHSMGGYIALAMAEIAPGRFKGLSLIHSTALPDDEEKKENRRKAIALIEKGGQEAFINANIPTLFGDVFKQAHPEVIAAQIREGLTVVPETLIAFYNAMIARPERLNILQGADFPVQWIIGDEDKVVPRQKSLHQSSCARVSFVVIYRETGHMSMLEQPEELAKDLRLFTVYCYNRKRSTH